MSTACHRPLTFLAASSPVTARAEGRASRLARAPRGLAWGFVSDRARERSICFTDRMPMFCPDCQRNLDDVPVGDPCPQCGGSKRSAVAPGQVAMVGVSAIAGTVSVGYNLQPGWAYQWRIIQRHLDRLREQYQGINSLGNLDVEENVHALFLSLFHLYDWLEKDSALSMPKNAANKWIGQHQNSLGICRAYANTWKHMTRDRPGALIALIIGFYNGPNGYKVTIGYRPHDQPQQPMTEVDGLDLAEKSEQDWRTFLNARGISIPT